MGFLLPNTQLPFSIFRSDYERSRMFTVRKVESDVSKDLVTVTVCEMMLCTLYKVLDDSHYAMTQEEVIYEMSKG